MLKYIKLIKKKKKESCIYGNDIIIKQKEEIEELNRDIKRKDDLLTNNNLELKKLQRWKKVNDITENSNKLQLKKTRKELKKLNAIKTGMDILLTQKDEEIKTIHDNLEWHKKQILIRKCSELSAYMLKFITGRNLAARLDSERQYEYSKETLSKFKYKFSYKLFHIQKELSDYNSGTEELKSILKSIYSSSEIEYSMARQGEVKDSMERVAEIIKDIGKKMENANS